MVAVRAAEEVLAESKARHHHHHHSEMEDVEGGSSSDEDWEHALALLPGHRPFSARLRIGEEVHELATHQLNIANGSHHAGRAIAPDTGLDDRQLVVYRLGDANRLGLSLATVRQTVIGPRRPLARTRFLTAREVWLETDPPLALDVDGEIRGRTPVRIALEANALRVMVGTGFPDR